jgi:hypothetical protein
MRNLIKYSDYTREEVHQIFASNSSFTPQAGTWGLQGIISIPDRSEDFVFFVTYGQQQGEHVFEEGITNDGILSWQSQPKQSLQDKQIQQLINHDDLTHSIYLFLRTEKKRKYSYLGKLKYLSHDIDREKPVWFQWQILDWNPSVSKLKQVGLTLQSSTKVQDVEQITSESGPLQEYPPPSLRARQGKTTNIFRARKIIDRSLTDARNVELGLAGEMLVLSHEMQSLRNSCRPELADKILHVARIEGDGAGYDILSYTTTGDIKYIEVKTTTSGDDSSFYMSSNEVSFANQHRINYYLYRVYNFDQLHNTGKFFVINGNDLKDYRLTPINYRVDLK